MIELDAIVRYILLIWVLNATETGQVIEFNAHGEVKTDDFHAFGSTYLNVLETGKLYTEYNFIEGF